MPGGHALLLTCGYFTGRKSLVRLVTHLANYKVFPFTLHLRTCFSFWNQEINVGSVFFQLNIGFSFACIHLQTVLNVTVCSYFVWLCVEFVFCSCLKWRLTIRRIVTKTQLNCCTVSWKMPASILAFVADRLSCSYMMTLLIHALLMSVHFWKMVIDSQLLLLLQCEFSKVSELMNFLIWLLY